ncbi:hypothetical protein BW730_14890 [Tessaracoccus aquimaris]|uniref:Activator of Hsp90 ATPase homologue 1/2-like C-terminal domain-containing protein n=1 Tax=Tessaracoccus aquimaris TaxID=1332264 RepID=A0A1Q2CRA2_9ACTN|nr:SRPBCC family protein [Tessaracoccus aquimaris]AQP48595.1 hypothetical protein BW730_14890 [Tessaracoccus aquimaris]
MSEFIRALAGSATQPSISLERIYPTDRRGLWGAVTSPSAASRWLGTIVGAPSRPGERFAVELGPDDVADCMLEDCSPMDRLVIGWTWGDEPPGRVTVELFDAEVGTGLRLTHALLTPDTGADYGGGWEELLTDLVAWLDGRPHPDRVPGVLARQWQAMADGALELVRDLPATPDRVWQALTSGMGEWWWSHWPDVTVEADVRPGGRYEIAAPGAGITLSGAYLAVEPTTHLAYTWQWSDADGTAPDEAVDLRLEAIPTGTRLTVRHTGAWADGTAAEAYREGWGFTLGQLEAALTAS